MKKSRTNIIKCVEWSEEDGGVLGQIPDSYHGDSRECPKNSMRHVRIFETLSPILLRKALATRSQGEAHARVV